MIFPAALQKSVLPEFRDVTDLSPFCLSEISVLYYNSICCLFNDSLSEGQEIKMNTNRTMTRFFRTVLCTIVLAGCSASGSAQKTGIQAFADKYTGAEKNRQIAVRNQERETILTDEEFAAERKKASSKILAGADCTDEQFDAGLKAYHAFETAYRNDMLKIIADAETEKAEAFTADPMNEYISFEVKEDEFDTTKNAKLTVYKDGMIMLRNGKEKEFFRTGPEIIDALDEVWHKDWETYYSAADKPCWVRYDADGNLPE